MTNFQQDCSVYLEYNYGKTLATSTLKELYHAVSDSAMRALAPLWKPAPAKRRAAYFSAEFLMGRMIYSNLLNLGILEDFKTLFEEKGLDSDIFEQIDDSALGNGGLGRLGACFLDSAATLGLPLDGYGLRYRYGLFKQHFENGFQKETGDDWLRFGDPWSIRREEDRVLVTFGSETMHAIPYDMPMIGYQNNRINTLRLWQAEALTPFDFDLFNQQKYQDAVAHRTRADNISDVLYPNDEGDEGKKLRLMQQYFFTSASLQDMLRRHKLNHPVEEFAVYNVIQLNDTHPALAIPELLRLLIEQENLSEEKAWEIVHKTFAYTNHTIMAEAMERWNISLLEVVVPHLLPYLERINGMLLHDLTERGIPSSEHGKYAILVNGEAHMARLAIYSTFSINGVAAIHTEILKENTLAEWYALYPQRFNNKTNGITQRRWLALSNPELAEFITSRIGSGWITELSQLEKLRPYAMEEATQREFLALKQTKKEQLADYVAKHEDGLLLNTNAIFDIQIKRLHEYKRQLLNAFSILDIYYGIKEGRIADFTPTVFLFGAKAAPGYYRAKGIIKLINEIGKKVNADPAMKDLLQVVFVQNYNVSYAEKLIPAANVSEQISTAGTEASGTGNMKFMLNGAVTLGTYDGANVEIVREAGEENNYIFGARVEDLEALDSYSSLALYSANPRIKRVVDSLVDGTFDDNGTGMFKELYTSLLKGADWHQPDHYYLLLDFLPYVERKLDVNRDYKKPLNFAEKCLLNISSAGFFSSDRTIQDYDSDIWHISS